MQLPPAALDDYQFLRKKSENVHRQGETNYDQRRYIEIGKLNIFSPKNLGGFCVRGQMIFEGFCYV